MGTFHFGLFFIGISGVEASVAAIVFQLGIVFSVLFARLFLGEVFGVRRTIGMVVAFGGEPYCWDARGFQQYHPFAHRYDLYGGLGFCRCAD